MYNHTSASLIRQNLGIVAVNNQVANVSQAAVAYGRGEMIPAIEEAVMTMAPGAKVTLLTPSSLAFGEFDLGETLPPYSPLKIELELVEIK